MNLMEASSGSFYLLLLPENYLRQRAPPGSLRQCVVHIGDYRAPCERVDRELEQIEQIASRIAGASLGADWSRMLGAVTNLTLLEIGSVIGCLGHISVPSGSRIVAGGGSVIDHVYRPVVSSHGRKYRRHSRRNIDEGRR